MSFPKSETMCLKDLANSCGSAAVGRGRKGKREAGGGGRESEERVAAAAARARAADAKRRMDAKFRFHTADNEPPKLYV